MFKKITSENVNIYAIKHYDNPHCENEKEFYDDMKRFKYIKRLLRKYKETNILKDDEKTKLMSLSGVKQYPMRVKCATLSWHTLTSALDNSDQIVKTEE